MKIDLAGKRAIVTGSTGGIGFAIAKGLVGTGAEVVVTGRTQAAVDKAVAAITSEQPHARVSGVAADLATPEGAAELIAKVPQADIFVSNPGIYGAKPAFELDDADWAHIFNVNVTSAARLARHYAPVMKEKGWGRLIFISSESAQNIPVEMIHYGVSKAALQALSRGYAKALAGTGVTSNAILPGPTRTESLVAFIADRPLRRAGGNRQSRRLCRLAAVERNDRRGASGRRRHCGEPKLNPARTPTALPRIRIYKELYR